jgi:hypothetical protein
MVATGNEVRAVAGEKGEGARHAGPVTGEVMDDCDFGRLASTLDESGREAFMLHFCNALKNLPKR